MGSMIIANNLKKRRKQLGLTQQLMSDLISVERSTYAYYETGKTYPSPETFLRICSMFDCTFEELLTEEKEDNDSLIVAEDPNFSLKKEDQIICSIKVAKRLISKISELPLKDRLEVENLVDKLLDEKTKK